MKKSKYMIRKSPLHPFKRKWKAPKMSDKDIIGTIKDGNLILKWKNMHY